MWIDVPSGERVEPGQAHGKSLAERKLNTTARTAPNMSSSETNGNGSVADHVNASKNSRSSFRDSSSNHEASVAAAAAAAVPLSNSALEAKAKQLQVESAKLSAALTLKLATSQSGQNLLHMGTSLSSLPPDLHALLQNLHSPLLQHTEGYEAAVAALLERVVAADRGMRHQRARGRAAAMAADAYQDLVAAERTVQSDVLQRRYGTTTFTTTTTATARPDPNNASSAQGGGDSGDDEEPDGTSWSVVAALTAARPRKLVRWNITCYVERRDSRFQLCLVSHTHTDELDHAAALERAAVVTVLLMQELQAANQALTTSLAVMHQQDTEHEQFLVKLAPRIRRLETDVAQCLSQRMELVLKQLEQLHRNHQQQQQQQQAAAPPENSNSDIDEKQEQLLVVLGHVMRGLAVSGRSKDVENIFARTAVVPVVRSKLSMGRLDEGGSRGECAGLTNLLNLMVNEIAETYSPVLTAAESMFSVRNSSSSSTDDHSAVSMDVDLLTAGVWVPIATALMADAGIKMSIFSPGIASILQANYTALDSFLSALSSRLLLLPNDNDESSRQTKFYRLPLSPERIQQAQDRIYAHPKTAEFSKKWNLPIYYQLRFGECCTRLNKAVDKTKLEGWVANVYSGAEEQGNALRQNIGFELSLFIELYDTLLGLWLPDVILRPLTNRFLRGAVQLVGRVVSFINDGLEGKVLFGEEPSKEEDASRPVVAENGTAAASQPPPAIAPPPSYPTRKPYCWGDSEEDVAAVAWELAILESTIRHDYATIVCEALSSNPSNDSSEAEQADLRELVLDVLKEASDQIHPTIDKAWNKVVVNLLIQKCSGPLAAVKGVAATYRMTNRPPPTQASPFVGTILRPLKEFDKEFANRIPTRIGSAWKQQVVVTVADRYAAAVDDLIATVQRTEVALKNRKARRTAAGGMSDGEKVKLQLYLDYQAFATSIREVGIEPATVIGLSVLGELTSEGEKLMNQTENGA